MLFQTTATDKFSQEVRLSSPNSEKFEWLAGLFYTHEKSKIDPQNYFATEFGTSTIATDVAQSRRSSFVRSIKNMLGSRTSPGT